MNFLSHYYFERYSHDPELVLGSILPDLVKNAAKGIHVLAHKYEERFGSNPKLNSIYRGWIRHLETDRIFHNSMFFYEKTHELKILLTPAVEDTPIRPSFLSHIALELLLDHLLLKNDWVNEMDFYAYLASVDRDAVTRFLNLCDVEDTTFFFTYFNSFIRAQYVGSYREFDAMTMAIINICRRLWDESPTPDQQRQLSVDLAGYAQKLAGDFKPVFEEIGAQLP